VAAPKAILDADLPTRHRIDFAQRLVATPCADRYARLAAPQLNV
jgi:hypothetical protein